VAEWTVTVSRLYGAGGLRVSRSLAESLGYRAVDREVVEEAARRLGVEPEVADSLDEKVPGLIEEIGLALAGADLPGGPPAPVEDRSLAEAIRRVITSLAAGGGHVIMGRGGQAVLRDHPRTVHLQLVGDPEDRARRICEWRGISLEEARRQCRRVDAERRAYVRRFHGVDIGDPLLYDAVLNTSRLGLDGAEAAALAAVRHRMEAG
jgi:cytidylate kinase